MPSPRNSEDGQAAVELVLATPIMVLMLLAAIQVAVVIGDQLALESVARNRARALALGERSPTTNARLDSNRVTMSDTIQDGVVTITVRYRAPTDIALIGHLIGDINLTSNATMLLEPG